MGGGQLTWFKETPAEGHGTWQDKVVRVDGFALYRARGGTGVVVHWLEDKSMSRGADIAVVGRIVGFDGCLVSPVGCAARRRAFWCLSSLAAFLCKDLAVHSQIQKSQWGLVGVDVGGVQLKLTAGRIIPHWQRWRAS